MLLLLPVFARESSVVGSLAPKIYVDFDRCRNEPISQTCNCLTSSASSDFAVEKHIHSIIRRKNLRVAQRRFCWWHNVITSGVLIHLTSKHLQSFLVQIQDLRPSGGQRIGLNLLLL